MTEKLAVVLESVEKLYATGGFRLGPISLTLRAGSAVAILGKNGSGKSTLFQSMTGNHDITAGSITIGGEKMHRQAFALKRRLGYLPQHMDLPRWVTGYEILSYAARLYEMPDPKAKIDAAIALWDFSTFAHLPLAACSYGMQKRIGLALATFHDPAVLILDEPFSGLDLFHIKALEDTIEARKRTDHVTILSTHVASYAARHCHEAHIIEGGSIRQVGRWAELDFATRIDTLEQLFFGASTPERI